MIITTAMAILDNVRTKATSELKSDDAWVEFSAYFNLFGVSLKIGAWTDGVDVIYFDGMGQETNNYRAAIAGLVAEIEAQI